jgi:tetratricopeptide (TPR) repeat protein
MNRTYCSRLKARFKSIWQIQVIFLGLLTLISFNCFSNIEFDSILSNQKLPDSVKVNLLLSIIDKNYLLSQPDSAFILSKKVVGFTKNLENDKLHSRALNKAGSSAYYKTDLPSAYNYYSQALLIRERHEPNKALVRSLINVGVIYDELSKPEQALDFYNQALRLAKELNYTGAIANILNNCGLIHMQRIEYEAAKKCLLESIEIQRELNQIQNMTIVLTNLGEIAQIESDWNLALVYYRRCQELQLKIGDEVGLAYTFYNLGRVYMKMNLFDDAMDFFNQGLEFHSTIEDTAGISLAYCYKSELMLKMNQATLAVEFGELSMKYSSMVEIPERMSNSARALWKAYKGNGKLQEADSVRKIYLLLKDSVSKGNTQDSLAREMLKIEIDLINKKLKAYELSKENSQNWGYVFTISLLLMVTVSFFLVKAIKKK